MPPFADPLASNCPPIIEDGVSASPLAPAPVAVDDLTVPVPGRFGWTAHDCDAQTGLLYNVTRYYCETQGQWTTQDPVGFAADDQDLHSYPGNAPRQNDPNEPSTPPLPAPPCQREAG